MVEQSVLFSGHDHLNVLLCLFAQIEGQFVHIYKTTGGRKKANIVSPSVRTYITATGAYCISPYIINYYVCQRVVVFDVP